MEAKQFSKVKYGLQVFGGLFVDFYTTILEC